MNIAVDGRCIMGGKMTGVGVYAFNFLKKILEKDKNNNYFLFLSGNKDFSESIPKLDFPNLKIVYKKYPNKFLNSFIFLTGLPKIDEIMEREIGQKIDVFFAPNINFLSLKKETKFILTVHDLSFEIFKDFFSPKGRIWHRCIGVKKQCQRADLILAPSVNTKKDLMDIFCLPENKIKVINPGLGDFLDLDKIETIKKYEKIKNHHNLSDKFILFVGTVEKRKNARTVVDAFNLWREKNSYAQEFDLVIAGKKGWKATEVLQEAKKNSHIKYVGFVDDELKEMFYKKAEIFVFPSFYEGFGFPVLEAMRRGTPVVVSNRSSLPETAGNAAFYVNPHNVSDLANALKFLTSDFETKNFFIQEGLKRCERFSWENSAEEFIDLLTKI